MFTTTPRGNQSKLVIPVLGILLLVVGRNLHSVGVSCDEIDLLLENDVQQAMAAAKALGYNTNEISYIRWVVIVNMAFNLGQTRFAKFKKFHAAVMRLDFQTAANEMLNSAWAKQVGSRAQELSEMMRRNEWPEWLQKEGD